MKKIIIAVLALALLLTLAGCADTTSTNATPTTLAPLKTADLANITWVLKSYDRIPALGSLTPTTETMTPVLTPWKDITLTFNSNLDNFDGNDGVNSYGGPCHIMTGYNISVSAITMTQMGHIGGPAGIDQQIQTYYKLLQNAANFSISSDGLRIFSSDGECLYFVRGTK
jgi:heat shock protein HslJ